MNDDISPSKKDFLFPIGNYHGEFSPENLIFNANLQEFAQKVSYLCALESNGKISGEDTYQQIKRLWKDLKTSKNELLDNSPLKDDSNPQ